MAKFRKIHTSFWTDSFVETLTPEERYFYKFLLTNPLSAECGIYEISIKKMCDFTGYNNETIQKLIDRFSDYGKIIFHKETSEIAILNRGKYFEKAGKPTYDCVRSELKKVKHKPLINEVLKMVDKECFREIYESYHDTSTIRGIAIPQERERERERERETENILSSLMKDFNIEHCTIADPEQRGIIETSIKLFNGFCKMFPENRDYPLIEKAEWIPPVRELMEKKGYTQEQLILVAEFALTDKFWKGKILNTKSLSDKFEALKIQYHASN
jgi:hypothetical protein